MEQLTATLTSYFFDPHENRSLAEVLSATPSLREFVDLTSLDELEQSPSWDATVVPLADGTLLTLDQDDATWRVVVPDLPNWADNR